MSEPSTSKDAESPLAESEKECEEFRKKVNLNFNSNFKFYLNLILLSL